METVTLTGQLKTCEGWHEARKDLGVYLHVGDAVDEAMRWYFLEVLPPACWRGDLIQIGEPANYNDTGETFATLQKHADQWVYTGNQNRGQRVTFEGGSHGLTEISSR